MMVLKVWGRPRRSNVSLYALYMMFIFYLAERGLAPTPQQLQEAVDEPEYEGEWQINFVEIPFVCVIQDTLKELLGGYVYNIMLRCGIKVYRYPR
jgi:hypothetical protein